LKLALTTINQPSVEATPLAMEVEKVTARFQKQADSVASVNQNEIICSNIVNNQICIDQ
jgi:hypothetical protein